MKSVSQVLKKVKATANLLGLLLIVVFLPGCMSPGQQLDPSAIAKLQKGMTRPEVHQLFGKPHKTTQGPYDETLDDFRVKFDMPKFSGSVADGTLTLRGLQVIYGGRNPVVVDFHNHEGKVPYRQLANGNIVSGVPGAKEKLELIRPNRTTFAELIRWFGPAHITRIDLERQTIYHWFFAEQQNRRMYGQELVLMLDKEFRVQDFRLLELDK